MSSAGGALKFIVGSRTLWAPRVDLTTVSYSLDDLIEERIHHFPKLGDGDGYRVLSAPVALLDHLPAGYTVGGVQRYRRHFIDMRGDYPAYIGRFSSKTRSTFARKRRKLAELGNGALDIRCYRSVGEIEAFLQLAAPLSRRTYQARLLDAGLPEDVEAVARMINLAAADQVRAYLLFPRRPTCQLSLSADRR